MPELVPSYERLCDSTDDVWPALCDRLDLSSQTIPASLQRSQRRIDDAPDAELREAEEVYALLRERETL